MLPDPILLISEGWIETTCFAALLFITHHPEVIHISHSEQIKEKGNLASQGQLCASPLFYLASVGLGEGPEGGTQCCLPE